MIWSSQEFGIYTPQENSVKCLSSFIKPTFGLIYLHGYEQNGATNWQTNPGIVKIFNSLCSSGFSIYSIDAGGQSTWANNSAMNAIDGAFSYLNQKYGFNKVSLLGQSMGGLNSLIWSNRNTDKVSCVSTMISVIDINDVKNRDPGYGAAIDAAYGGSYSDAMYGDTNNPMLMADNGIFNESIKYQMWYGVSDGLCIPDIARRFQGKLRNVSAIQVAGGHAVETIQRIDPTRMVKFMLENQ